MEKKLIGMALTVIMLLIILCSSISVTGQKVKLVSNASGTLVVYVKNQYNQTISNANITAISLGSCMSYNIPFNNMTKNYKRALPAGGYNVIIILYGQYQIQRTNISVGKTTTLFFYFGFNSSHF